jgi:diguanylate cyclase (GGDEF)-like protein
MSKVGRLAHARARVAADVMGMSSRVTATVARVLLCVTALLIAVWVLHALTGVGEDRLIYFWINDAAVALSALTVLWRALRVPEQRLAWALIGLGMVSWASGNIYYFSGVLGSTPPTTSLADVGWLGLYPLVYAAVVLLARQRLRGLGAGLWLDGVALALALGAIGSQLLLSRVVAQSVPFLLAYPIGDIVLVTMIAVVLLLLGGTVSRSWLMMGAGFLTFSSSDVLYSLQTAAGTYQPGRLQDVGWLLGPLLVATAASLREQPGHRREIEVGVLALAAPVVAAFSLVGVLIAVAVGASNLVSVVLTGLGLAVVIVRMALTLRDNHRLLHASRHEAATDALTRLGNRRRLVRDLDAALADADGGANVLALFDLDGFKGYNDTFGHPAGDALLVHIGRALQAALEGSGGTAYRMGGDEFCVLLRAPDEDAAKVLVGRLAAAMRQSGEGFDVTASRGSAWLPGLDASHALRLADQRMYSCKQGSLRGPKQQTADALATLTHERQPALGQHGDEVGELAMAVARQLAVPEREIADIREAARLHDIGKMAIPDAVLDKRGPLDDGEWEFMRRHTVIGERVLASAPALEGIGLLVRSSHERWDGAGYPDGLAADDIPLGARIVFVCDAYHAMTTDRPYQEARDPQAVLAEIRRCAGTQFDPGVVEALGRALSTERLRLLQAV